MPPLPTSGTRIIFDREPLGSYASAGRVYVVDVRPHDADVRLTNPETGSSCHVRKRHMTGWRLA